MKKITTFLGFVGVVCFFSGCTSDNLESIVAAENITADISSAGSSSTSTASTSSTSKDQKKPSSNSSTSPESDTTVIRDQVKVSSKIEMPNYSSGVFCWSEECAKKYAGVSSNSNITSSSSYSIEINMSQEAQVLPTVTENQMIDNRDQATYPLTRIGGVHWMAKNITYNTGDPCYGDDNANCSSYGRMYSYASAQKACPTGWSLPTREQFKAAMADTTFWQYGGRKSSSYDFKDDMGFYWLRSGEATVSGDDQNCNTDKCGVIFVAKSCDYGDKNCEMKFQNDSQTKLFSVRCVEGQ